ncbi:hypothetical protein [Clostridium beijerinckii]|nr:hypothetical protein [Clostridium beijerinckii]
MKLIRPVFMSISKDENQAVRPAVKSIIRILKAARNANIKHAVMESIC